MPLVNFMTQTASTKRFSAISSGKRGTLSNHLTSLKITPVMLPDSRSQSANIVRQALGLEGTAVQIFEAYTESHAHTDGGTPVTQMPDIITGDRLVVGSITYQVRWAEQQPATTSFGATLLLYLTEDKSA
jgi:hypothetical protein